MPTAAAKQADTHPRAGRGRLAAMVTRLLEHWQLSATEQAIVLGLSAGSRSTGSEVGDEKPSSVLRQ